MLQEGLRKEDRSHVHLVEGDGRNGFKKGQFGVTVDAGYKSKSENFQFLQKAANDHSATAQVDVLSSKDTVSLKIFNASPQKEPVNSSFPLGSVDQSFQGYTFFEYRGNPGAPGPFSAGDYTNVVVHGDQTDIEISESMHHELRHVVLGDFGRSIPAAEHGRGNVDKQTKAAEDEARQNAKDQ